MMHCKHTAALVSAASLAMGTFAFAQAPDHTAMDPQNSPAAQQGNVGGRVVAGDMSANMDADKTINMQLMKFAGMPDKAPDMEWALMAGCGNMEEIEFSKLEAEKGSDQKVKDLAKMIMQDHQDAQDKLKPIAEKMGVTFPTMLPTMKQQQLNILAAQPADKIDKMYLSMMKGAHLKAVSDYTDHSKAVMDPDLKTYTSETLPKLREHTAAVLKLNDEMGMPVDLHFKGMNGMKMNNNM